MSSPSPTSFTDMISFVLAALQPPAAYFTLALSGHVSSSLPALSLLLVTSLPALLWISARSRHRFCGAAPAYASVVGHFGSALLTFIFKVLPVAGRGLSIVFFMTSGAFAVVFARMVVGNPGRIDYWLEQKGRAKENFPSSENSLMIVEQGKLFQKSNIYDELVRGKYCEHCASYIERYDHHCAAIQNCVGLKNTGTFLVLLTTLCIMETAYLKCCYLYVKCAINLSANGHLEESDAALPENIVGLLWELLSNEAWVLGTALFVGLQILWQVPYLVFQLYLIGINLTMDEWVHWEEIPRFYRPANTFPGLSEPKTFCNPYDKGFLKNYKAMLNHWTYPTK